MKRRGLIAAAALATAGGLAFEIERRRLIRLRDADPAWHELNTPLQGRIREVTSADGTRIHAEIFGRDDAPSIVLMHGWLEAIEFWHHQIRDLARDFRVVAYDQRGHGGSAAPHAEAYTDEALSDDLDAVLTSCVPAGQQCIVAGHSMGGMALVAWAGRHVATVHDRVAGAALIHSGTSELFGRLALIGSRAGARAHSLFAEPFFLSQFAWPERFDPVGYQLTRRIAFGPHASVGTVAFAHRMFTGIDPPVRAGFGRMFIPLDLTASVDALTVPAIVIGGRHDRLLPIWHSRQLADALPNVVEYVELPDAGHMAPLEAPGEVTSRLDHLARACLMGASATRGNAAAV